MSKSNSHILALDFGTSSTRALLFNSSGHKVGEAAQKPYDQTTTADGGVEVDADLLFDLTLECIDELQAGSEASVAAVAISCFWHSLMAVDENGKPLTALFSWADNRAAAWVAPLRATMNEEETHARTGCVFHTSYWPAKLLWLHHTRPELFTEMTRWISFGEYFMLRLFGKAGVSLSMASGTGLFHQVNCDWDDDVLAQLPVGRENLSPLCDFDEPAGELTPEYQKRWPNLKDAKWFPALGDGACSNVGSGGIDGNRFVINVGTSGAVRIVLRDLKAPAPRGLWRYRLDRERSLVGGAVSNAGNVFAWISKNLKLPENLEEHVAAIAPDGHGLTVLPFLAGERSPLWNADARFVLAGANLDTSPSEIVRASLEGASLRFAEITELLRESIEATEGSSAPAEIVASGGALQKSATWTHIMCDCLGAEVVESREPEASARGAALMALEAAGIITDISELPAELGERVKPDAANAALYKRALERQNALIETLLGDPLHARHNL